MNMWLKCEEREINVIRSCMDIIDWEKVKIVSGENELYEERLDSSVQHALCFIFTYVVDYDPHLKVLAEFSDASKPFTSHNKLQPPANKYWFATDDVGDTMRVKSPPFLQLCQRNGQPRCPFPRSGDTKCETRRSRRPLLQRGHPDHWWVQKALQDRRELLCCKSSYSLLQLYSVRF